VARIKGLIHDREAIGILKAGGCEALLNSCTMARKVVVVNFFSSKVSLSLVPGSTPVEMSHVREYFKDVIRYTLHW
jgi:hypothetical protein